MGEGCWERFWENVSRFFCISEFVFSYLCILQEPSFLLSGVLRVIELLICRSPTLYGHGHICQNNTALQWRHNDRDSVSNPQPHDCLLKHLFRLRSKKTPKLRVTGLCEGNSPVTGEFPHKGPLTRKKFPFEDVIMVTSCFHERRWRCPEA